MPRQRGAVVVRLGAVPLRAGLPEHQLAEGAVVEQALQLDQARLEAVLGDHGQRHPGFARCVDEPVSGVQANVDRLLHDQVLARRGGLDPDDRVQAARYAHAHHLDIAAGQQRGEVGLGQAAARGGEGRDGAGGSAGDSHQPGLRQRGDGVGVNRRDHPGADDSETAVHRRTLMAPLRLVP